MLEVELMQKPSELTFSASMGLDHLYENLLGPMVNMEIPGLYWVSLWEQSPGICISDTFVLQYWGLNH